MTRDYITPPNFDVHHDAIEGATPDPWGGYSRLDRLDGLDTRGPAPFPPVPARSVADRITAHPVESWSRKLTVLLVVPPVLLMAGILGLLIAQGLVR